METVELVRELAATGLTARQIAVKIGRSRQRVYQLAREHRISLPQATFGAVQETEPARAPPQARARTGGIDVPLSHSVVGSISELLAAVDLMARGFEVYIPIRRSRGHDIIADINGKLASFEVRSAYRNLSKGLSFNRKSNDKSDYYALVVAGEPVIYKPDLPALKARKHGLPAPGIA